MLPAMMFYDLVLTIHVLAVVVAFGVLFAYPLIDAQIRRADPASLPALHRLHATLARRLITPAMTVVLVAGLYMALDRYSMSKPWIGATFVILFVLFGLTGAVLTPTDVRLAKLAERDLAAGGTLSAEYEAQARRAALFGSIALLLVVVAIFVMVAKPGA